MLEYVGRGSWLPGVPARNLSQEEVIQLGGMGPLVDSGLYRLAKGEDPELDDRPLSMAAERKAEKARRKNKAFIPAENKAGE